MSVVIAHRAVDFTEDFDITDLLQATLQSISDVGNLLTHSAGARSLAVCSRQHGLISPLVCHVGQCCENSLRLWNQDFVAGRFNHLAIGQVVDVFTGAGEVNKFADLVELGIVLNRFFEEVLDGFYIVVVVASMALTR